MLFDIAWPGAPALALGAGAFVLGGSVKGALGIGLPLVALPLLGLGFPPTQAIAMMAFATAATVPMTLALPEATLRRVLAGVVLLAVLLNAVPLRLTVPPTQERWWSAAVGLLSGVMGAMSALTGPIVISYLMSLRLSREAFVGTISVIYLSGSLPLLRISARVLRDVPQSGL